MNRERMALAVIAIAVTVAAVVVHKPCVQNGFLHLDDYSHLEEARQHQPVSWNAVVWAFSTANPFTYFPLNRLATVLQYQWFGMQPAGYHATSLVLHGLNTAMATVLVWLLMSGIATMSLGERCAVAGGVGLLFGVHPLQVEPVDWFSEKLTLISAFFALASMCTYVQAVRRPGKPLWHAATAVLFAGALLSKASTVSLPLAMLALDYYPLRRHEQFGWWRLLKEKAVLIAMSAVMSVVTIQAASRTGFVVGLSGIGLMERWLVAIRGSIFYLWKLMWPAWLSPWYPLQGLISLWQVEYLTATAVFIVATAICVWARHRAPGLLAAWIAYLALLLPVSGLVQAGGQAAADRYMYVALMPPALVAAAACVWVWRRAVMGPRIVLILSLICLFDLYAIRTREQIACWRNDVSLWQSALAPFPNSLYLNAEMYRALTRDRRFDEALVFAHRAVQLDPSSGELHGDLGALYLLLGQYENAVPELEEALRLSPTLSLTRYNLACAYSQLGKFDQALESLDKLLLVQPDYTRIAARDMELAKLRRDPEYGPRFAALVAASTNATLPP